MSITLRSKGRILCFSSSYASHSGHDVEMNISFYQEAQSYVRKSKGAHFLGRDFNARLHHRYQPEESALGPYVHIYIYTGFMLFLVSAPLKLSQVGVPWGSLYKRYI